MKGKKVNKKASVRKLGKKDLIVVPGEGINARIRTKLKL